MKKQISREIVVEKVVIRNSQFDRELLEQMYLDIQRNKSKVSSKKKKGA